MSFILLGILNSQAAGAGAAGDYDLLETTVLTSSASSVSFTGLDSYTDYKHLQIRAVSKTDRPGTGDQLLLNINSDTTASYAHHALFGNRFGSPASISSTSTNAMQVLRCSGDSPSLAFGPGVTDILDFSSTSKNTTIRDLSGAADNTIFLFSGVYLKTDAVTSLTLTPNGGNNILTGSRFSLYGIKGA